jgi:hypothetical protein
MVYQLAKAHVGPFGEVAVSYVWAHKSDCRNVWMGQVLLQSKSADIINGPICTVDKSCLKYQ